ncbi:MAG: asparagine synthase-related protein, partial [Polaromonas sp.]
MAVFLAAYCLHQGPVPDTLAQRLCTILAPAGNAELHVNGACAVAYVDLGLWPGSSAHSDENSFTIIGGDPVLCDGNQTYGRSEGMARLTQDIITRGEGALRNAEGTFAGLVLDRQGSRLQVFTDKMGVRPIYWAQTDSHVFVSSSFWALHALPGLNQRPNWQAAAETAAFGYPLGNRTLVEPLAVLGGGRSLCIDKTGVNNAVYWDWSQLTPNNLHGAALLTHIEQSFHDAVDRRCQGQTEVMAFLSGGMDSRLIVSRLRERGLRVHSLNFAPEGSQDLVFGRMVAEQLGCKHFEFGRGDLDFSERQTAATKAWEQINSEVSGHPEKLGLVWSGDGGSVGLGHVYLSSAAVAISRRQGLRAAALELQRVNKTRISPLLLRSAWRHLADLPLKGILEDLQSRPTMEPGRSCHLFYMLNDQRRHLTQHFETLHLRRVDLVLPFFDGRFLTAVLTSPVDEFLEHRLYNDLMKRLPMGGGQVPWQAYPGHLPCP